jgi:hypothetical protein
MFTGRMLAVYLPLVVSGQCGDESRDEEGPVIDLTAHERPASHRGRYILERGWSVQGATRRRAATVFRAHIQSMRPSESTARSAEERRARADQAALPT